MQRTSTTAQINWRKKIKKRLIGFLEGKFYNNIELYNK